jgi:hypothetical protein
VVEREVPEQGAAVPIRTLWHVLYEPDTAAMTASFHVRDTESGESAGADSGD